MREKPITAIGPGFSCCCSCVLGSPEEPWRPPAPTPRVSLGQGGKCVPSQTVGSSAEAFLVGDATGAKEL